MLRMKSSYKKICFGIVALSALALLMASCAPYQANKGQAYFKQRGKASWYGPGFAGRKTANGERFNPNQLTAAHKKLPFNTTLRVTNLDNGKSVIVRINDRGPYAGRRIIDLSKAAAKKIDMLGSGTAMVEIETVSPGKKQKHKEIAETAPNKSEGLLLAKRGPVRRNGVEYLIEKEGVGKNPAPSSEVDEIKRVEEIVAETRESKTPRQKPEPIPAKTSNIEDSFVVTTSKSPESPKAKPAKRAQAPKASPQAPPTPAAAPETAAKPEPAEEPYSVNDETF